MLTSLIGQRLGRYLIEAEIGRGGMARVYRARDTQLRRTVALKVLAPQLALDNEFIRRFEREAVIAANLQHPNIVTIFDVSEHQGLPCIAMEYIQGRTLHAIISERGALGLSVAIPVIRSVGAALDYAHSQDSVHRDIKPHNILLDVGGRILLTDFGIAQAPESRDGERLTRTGIFMGTPEYISPEQASAQRVDGRSDLYSLGITAFEIITGKVPFSGATPQLMLAHLQTPPPALSSIDPTQPPELDLVLARALAKNPDRRYQSGTAFVEALRNVADSYQIAEASTSDLTKLVDLPSSAGQGTISIDRTKTERGAAPPSRQSRPPAVLPDDRSIAPTPRAQPPQPRRQTPPASSQPRVERRSDRPALQVDWSDWRIIAPAGGLVVLLLLLLARAVFGSPQPLPTATPTPLPPPTIGAPTSIPPTLFPTATLTPTATPTATPEPTATVTPTRVVSTLIPPPTRVPLPPPTSTPEPPTSTPILPTATSLPPTATPTLTPIPPTVVFTAAPTDTPTATSPPTHTPTATSPPTDTPTATSPPTETATNIPVP